MIKRLRKVGNGNALLLDKPLLELLGLEANGAVQLQVRDGSLIVTPVDPQVMDSGRLDKCFHEVLAENDEVFRRLAQ